MESEPVVASVLLVDDHPANLLALEGILEPLHHRLIKASSGEEALKLLLDHEFAAILMDVQMPGLDGVQTARIIKERERTRHIPIIFLTAISRDAAHIFKGYSAGAVDYLLKPFDPDILRQKVQVFIDLWVVRKRLERREAAIREREREMLERENEFRFRNLTNGMPLAVVAGRPDGTVYWTNRVWHEYTGLTLAETAKGAHLDAVHPDDRERLVKERELSLTTNNPFELEFRIRRHDGAYRWFLVRGAPERDSKGEVVGWIGTYTDIDDQKRDRERLREFKATLDATEDGVLIVQADDLRLRYVNEGAVGQLGYSADELHALRITDVQPFEEAEFRSMVSALEKGEARALTYRTEHRRKDGEQIPVEVVLQFVRPAGMSGGRYVCIARDIRQRVASEEALLRANEAKDAFIAAASHELRTPLAAAKAQAQLALRRLRDEADAPPVKSLKTISAQIDRMAKLVEDLLDVSRVQVGRLSLETSEFDLGPLVRELTERIQALSEAHPIELSLPQGEVKLQADRGRVDQVITNLLSNAIRYSPKGGRVQVQVEESSDSIHLSVKDNGIGIPPEKQSMIFERFGRAHGSKYGGLGLGLTISQGIVEQHGGEIWVESSGVAGEGSTFHVRFPRRPTQRPTPV
ncbi:MAG: hybrid sensor histidine kinase/response regulator [Polyangiales bacterium]